jgi:hypothetical protein
VKDYSPIACIFVALDRIHVLPGMDGQSFPCEQLSHSCPPELDLSLSAWLVMTICFLVAFATIGVYLTGTLKRRRIPKLSSEEWAQIEMRLVFRISACMSRVSKSITELNGSISADDCKSIVASLSQSLDFSIYRIRAYCAENGPEDEAILDCIGKTLRSGTELRSYLSATSLASCCFSRPCSTALVTVPWKRCGGTMSSPTSSRALMPNWPIPRRCCRSSRLACSDPPVLTRSRPCTP